MTAGAPRADAAASAAAAGGVLLTLASGQFLMALDSSVMNVSIATVAAGAVLISALTTSFLAGGLPTRQPGALPEEET